MNAQLEIRLFYAAVAAVLAIPLVVGPVAGFGGLEAMAWLFGAEGPIVVPVSLRSGLRTICFLFLTLVPLVVWSLAAMRERAGAFRIILTCAFVSGLARLTGYIVEGNPGTLATAFLIIELAGMPALFLWHSRLIRGAAT